MSQDLYHKKNCRICFSSDLREILDLGAMPLSNAFLKKEDLEKEEKRFPLAVYFCQNCGLLQLLDVVNPQVLFRHYYYLTSTSRPLAEHFIELGKNLADKFIEFKDDLVIDIGGNDAVLLDNIKNRCRVLNIEPAENIAKISREKGVETIDELFSRKLAEEIFQKNGLAKVITASNVVAHIDDLSDLFEGVKILLGEKGIFVFEVHWVANLLGLAGVGGFDQIYHEHLSYFSLSSLKKLVSQFGLKIFDVKLISIHGRSLRVYVGKNYEVLKSVDEFLKQEKNLGLNKIETYLDFAERVARNKNALRRLLLKLKTERKKIAGYGAPAKGNTLLNYCQINNRVLDFLIDDSPQKQGLFTPGTRIPIYPRKRLETNQPDYLLLLAWNYTDSILEKEKDLIIRGVKFIIPVPEVKII